MAMFMQVRERRVYGERRVLTKCKELMRFESENIDFLAEQFLPPSDETRGKALTPRQRLEIFLRYTADPGFQSGVAEDIGVDRSTVCKNINYVMNCILENADNWIHFPSTVQEINNAKLMWQRNFDLPTVVGALDCTHIEIKKPSMFGDEYINRKGYPSINVQATCDSQERFTSVAAEWPGSVHDSRIWRRSPVRDIISRYDGAA
ncbi:putative nuclease HARBI1, partial [Homalodisca vitripennis]|uniref:putative nuclease HARBI1 n=1 Tax=Homalodisca vitripennis TaxID=197043 RepID=UPI001EEC6B17